MTRIIINYDGESLNEQEMLDYVNAVIKQGKISTGTYGEQYCFVTTFGIMGVSANKNKRGTHTFTIFRQP